MRRIENGDTTRRDFIRHGSAISLVLAAENILRFLREGNRRVSPDIANKNFENFSLFQKGILEQIEEKKNINAENLLQVDKKLNELEEKILAPDLKTRDLGDVVKELSAALFILNSATKIMAENSKHILAALSIFLDSNPGLTGGQKAEILNLQTQITGRNNNLIEDINARVTRIHELDLKIKHKLSTPPPRTA